MSLRKALITGITGQDGSYLAELLLEKGYEVHGIVRRGRSREEVDVLGLSGAVGEQVHFYDGDVTDLDSLMDIVRKVVPDECYHLAAQSFVSYSFEESSPVMIENMNGTLNVLTALHAVVPRCRFYFAGSSEMFGLAEESPQNEKSRFHPRAPYGISKVAGYYLVQNFREEKGMFAVNGILYNHESPRRRLEFVTRKITRAVAEIKLGRCKELRLGNLDASRDWGFSGDYVKAMWLMLQQKRADDYIIATGQLHTVREFVAAAFDCVGLDWEKYVIVDERFYRPSEKNPLCGDASKARRMLDWTPTVSFQELVKMMVEEDLRRVGND